MDRPPHGPVRPHLPIAQPPAGTPPALSPGARAAILAVDRGILHLARHWLLAVNVLGGIVAALPVLAPWLLAHGAALPARAIFVAYHLICHQRPERSFFVFGRQMAYCQRNTAIYTGIFALGLGYASLRGRFRPLRWRWMVLLWAPMALDGFTQLFGWRESIWELRVVTGALFALACVWVGFPIMEQAFGEMRRDLERRFTAGVAASPPAD